MSFSTTRPRRMIHLVRGEMAFWHNAQHQLRNFCLPATLLNMQPYTKYNSVYLPHTPVSFHFTLFTIESTSKGCIRVGRRGGGVGEHKIAQSHYRRRPRVSSRCASICVCVCASDQCRTLFYVQWMEAVCDGIKGERLELRNVTFFYQPL